MSYKLIVLGPIGACALIGFIIGLCKGSNRVKKWGLTYALTVLISTFALSKLQNTLLSLGGYAVLGISVAVVLVVMLLLMLFFSRSAHFLHKCKEKAIEKSRYKHMDEEHEREESIIEALDNKDVKTYRKLTRHKRKYKSGWAGFFDCLYGGIFLAAKGAVISGLIISFLLVVINVGDFKATEEIATQLFADKLWIWWQGKIFDALLIALLCICIHCGYRGGVVNTLCAFGKLGVIVAAIFAAYLLSGNSAFDGIANNVANTIAGKVAFLNNPKFIPIIGRVVVAVLIFVIELIPVVLICVFVPRLLESASSSQVFQVVDGVVGAVVLTAVVFGILLVFGSVYYTVFGSVTDIPFITNYNAFFNGELVSCFHAKNPLNALDFIKDLPIRGWFFPQAN